MKTHRTHCHIYLHWLRKENGVANFNFSTGFGRSIQFTVAMGNMAVPWLLWEIMTSLIILRCSPAGAWCNFDSKTAFEEKPCGLWKRPSASDDQPGFVVYRAGRLSWKHQPQVNDTHGDYIGEYNSLTFSSGSTNFREGDGGGGTWNKLLDSASIFSGLTGWVGRTPLEIPGSATELYFAFWPWYVSMLNNMVYLALYIVFTASVQTHPTFLTVDFLFKEPLPQPLPKPEGWDFSPSQRVEVWAISTLRLR